MDKPLEEMTLEELWELFPIVLSAHNDCWKQWFEEEARVIQGLLHGKQVRISHIGSTAVPGIWAKPIVDILVEVPENIPLAAVKDILVHNGYVCMSQADNRISLNKGYTSRGFAERVFHIHLRRFGDHDELYFRDYLNDFPAAAMEYEKLKLSLWKKYEHDRDAYTDAKSVLVKKYTECAKAEYGSKYDVNNAGMA